MGEEDLILSRSIWDMSISVKGIGFSTEESNDKFVIGDEFLEAIAVNSSGWRSGLLDNVVDDRILGSSSLVVRWISSPSNKTKLVFLNNF